MELNDALKQRRSVRHYSMKKVPFQKIAEICEAATYLPMAGNIFSVKLIIVSKKDKIRLIANACQQPFIAEAEYVVVVCSKKDSVLKSYGKRGEAYIFHQAGAAIENMLLKTIDVGLSTCWIGWFDEDIIKRILFIPDDIQVEAMLPIGYSFEKARTRKKPDLKLITSFEKYGQNEKKISKKIFD